jgi:hypothetical protein
MEGLSDFILVRISMAYTILTSNLVFLGDNSLQKLLILM